MSRSCSNCAALQRLHAAVSKLDGDARWAVNEALAAALSSLLDAISPLIDEPTAFDPRQLVLPWETHGDN